MYKDTSQAYCGAYKEIYLNGFALWDHPQKCLNFEPFVRICIRGLYLMCLGLVQAGFVFVSVNHFLYKLWRCGPDITWNCDRDKGTRLQPLLLWYQSELLPRPSCHAAAAVLSRCHHNQQPRHRRSCPLSPSRPTKSLQDTYRHNPAAAVAGSQPPPPHHKTPTDTHLPLPLLLFSSHRRRCITKP